MVIEEVPTPVAKQGEALIRVTACGVCHTDLHVAKGEVAFPMPCVLGHEISGVIAAVGPEVSGFGIGAHVVCSFIMPCGYCEHCVQGRDDLCDTFFRLNRLRGTLYDGQTRLHRANGAPLSMYSMGGLAEYAVVPATDVFRAPPCVPLADSCILGCAVMTAYGALKHQAEIKTGQTLAVIGIGGIGSSVIQIARGLGAGRIIAVDVRDDKLAEAKSLGATDVINAAKEDPVERLAQLTNGRGVDVALEALGRPETVRNAFLMTKDGGRTVVIGIGAGQAVAPIEITRLVRRGIRLCGSYGCRVRSDMPEVIRLADNGKVNVSGTISRRFSLENVNEALQTLDRGEIIGRAIIVL
jgi:S-(hydroxymethyl)glutathione dehydrogenase/alcohol dehydrogenase